MRANGKSIVTGIFGINIHFVTSQAAITENKSLLYRRDCREIMYSYSFSFVEVSSYVFTLRNKVLTKLHIASN